MTLAAVAGLTLVLRPAPNRSRGYLLLAVPVSSATSSRSSPPSATSTIDSCWACWWCSRFGRASRSTDLASWRIARPSRRAGDCRSGDRRHDVLCGIGQRRDGRAIRATPSRRGYAPRPPAIRSCSASVQRKPCRISIRIGRGSLATPTQSALLWEPDWIVVHEPLARRTFRATTEPTILDELERGALGYDRVLTVRTELPAYALLRFTDWWRSPGDELFTNLDKIGPTISIWRKARVSSHEP